MRTPTLVITTSLLFFYNAVLADTATEYKNNVDAIGKQIEQISRNLNANKALLKTEQDTLLKIEKEISALTKDLQKTDIKMSKQRQYNEQLSLQVEQLRQQQTKDKQALSNLLLHRYTNGKVNYIQKVLNQKNPYAVGRLNNYYDYFSVARQQKMIKLKEQIQLLENLQQQQKSSLAELEQTQQHQQRQQKKLDQSKKQRQTTVVKLNSKVSSSSEKLEKLKQDRLRLNKLLKGIASQAEKLRKLEQQKINEQKKQTETKPAKPPVPRTLVKGGFIKQQGRLRFPVQGKIKFRYGSRLPESGMRAEGMFFDTAGAVAVNSIFRGQVLFADFLKGYGLLLIIDHGDEHISLYGHNELLYKNVGDTVETNEVVAKSGVTGGLKSHGTYFEIRNNATPIDPAHWFQ